MTAMNGRVPSARHCKRPTLCISIQVHSCLTASASTVSSPLLLVLLAAHLSTRIQSLAQSTASPLLLFSVLQASKRFVMGNGVSTTDLILASGRIDREHVPADDREWNVFFEAPSTMEVSAAAGSQLAL
jgi:hypothetical protein